MHHSIFHTRFDDGAPPRRYLHHYLQHLDHVQGTGVLGLAGLANLSRLVVGFRSRSSAPDRWDDIIAVPSRREVTVYTEVTTDPGAYWLGSRMGSPRGTAILKHGVLHRDAWVRGLHKGDPDRPGLVQHNAAVTVWRDTDRDGATPDATSLVTLPEQTGYFGINFHSTRPARTPPERVGPWSAGCQVFRHPEALDDMLSRLAPGAISYLLLDQAVYTEWFEATFAPVACLALGVE